jgi:hypothetical protein
MKKATATSHGKSRFEADRELDDGCGGINVPDRLIGDGFNILGQGSD